MKSLRIASVLSLVAAAVVVFSPHRAAAQDGRSGAVFAMTNAASNNQINAYLRLEDGSLEFAGAFSTGGNGSGGTLDPLGSQGSLALTPDHRLLFAVNAGSGTVSSFAVRGAQLTLVDTVPTDGGFPTSVAQVGSLLYVLNAGGNGSVSGFRLLPNGHLLPIRTRRVPSATPPPRRPTLFLVPTGSSWWSLNLQSIRSLCFTFSRTGPSPIQWSATAPVRFPSLQCLPQTEP